MLYVSTRNQTDTFTAYKALNEKAAPDGGIYIPFHLPVFNHEEINAIKGKSCCSVIAEMLNLFFGVRLTELDVEFVISKTPFKTEVMQHKFIVAECWLNPGYSYDYLIKTLYGLIADKKVAGKIPEGWACVGIKIALMFGLYAMMGNAMQGVDVAITAGDYSDLAAIAYCKAMGLPLHTTICACEDNDPLYDLINKGVYTLSASQPDYIICFLCATLGKDAALSSAVAKQNNVCYRVTEEHQAILAEKTFAAVVSTNREDTVISSMYRTNGYTFDSEAALAYGGLQDYRSCTGVSKDTLLFSKNRPARIKE